MGSSDGSSKETLPQSIETFKVSDLKHRDARTRFEGHYTFEDLKTDGPAVCHWHIRPITAGLTVQGDIHAVLDLECARCLGAFTVPVDIEINDRYVFASYVDPYEREKELQATDFFETVDEEGILDLKDLAHQFLILESENHTACNRTDCDFVRPEIAD